MPSVEYNDFNTALKRMKKDIEKAEPLVMLAVIQQFLQDVDTNIAHDKGDLKKSGVNTPIRFQKQGIVIWTTPYAKRRYFQNYKNPHTTKWDIKTFNQNSEDYAMQLAKRYDENLYK